MDSKDTGYFEYDFQNKPFCIKSWKGYNQGSIHRDFTQFVHRLNVGTNNTSTPFMKTKKQKMQCKKKKTATPHYADDVDQNLCSNQTNQSTRVKGQYDNGDTNLLNIHTKQRSITDDFIHPNGLTTYEMTAFVLCDKLDAYLSLICTKIEAYFNVIHSEKEQIKHCIREIVNAVFSYNGKISILNIQKIIKRKHYSDYIDAVLHTHIKIFTEILHDGLDDIMEHVNIVP